MTAQLEELSFGLTDCRTFRTQLVHGNVSVGAMGSSMSSPQRTMALE
jgi:hypothetical protein